MMVLHDRHPHSGIRKQLIILPLMSWIPPSWVRSSDLSISFRRDKANAALGCCAISKQDSFQFEFDFAIVAVRSCVFYSGDLAVQNLAFAQQGHTVHHQWTGEAERNVVTFFGRS